jgi:hypothetical protein
MAHYEVLKWDRQVGMWGNPKCFDLLGEAKDYVQAVIERDLRIDGVYNDWDYKVQEVYPIRLEVKPSGVEVTLENTKRI